MPQQANSAAALPACLGHPCAAQNSRSPSMTHRASFGLMSAYNRGDLLTTTDISQAIHLSVWLHGHAVLHINAHVSRVNTHDTMLMAFGDMPVDIHVTACAQHVDLLLQREQLLALGGEQSEGFFAALPHGGIPRIAPANADTLRSANELAAALLTSTSCGLLRDAKSLELLAHMLAANMAPVPMRITPAQRECLQHARKLLLADLANPPTIAQLARHCGLNTFKLKQGFRSLFGHSIYALYQSERMQKAWQLIESGHMDVSSAGHHVGYTNLSHFSDAFRKQFGLLPGELKRCVSQRC
ncbi:MAG: helix-turn-helix transcriptional regulator [Rhodanobacter sp.]